MCGRPARRALTFVADCGASISGSITFTAGLRSSTNAIQAFRPVQRRWKAGIDTPATRPATRDEAGRDEGSG